MYFFKKNKRCEFKGTDGVERFKFLIPSDIKKSNKFLKSWKYPKNHPKKMKKNNLEEEKEEEEENENEEENEKNEDKPEDEIPEGMEMYGIKKMIFFNLIKKKEW